MIFFQTENTNITLFSSLLVVGVLFVNTALFNAALADGSLFKKKGSCTLKCKPDDPKTPKGGETCVFVPTGCNNWNKLGTPNSQLKQLTNPRLVNPELIIPKRKTLPGDAFKSKLLPGDAFKPK